MLEIGLCLVGSLPFSDSSHSLYSSRESLALNSSFLSLTDMVDLISVLANIVFLSDEYCLHLQRVQLGVLSFCIWLRPCPVVAPAVCSISGESSIRIYSGRLLCLRRQLCKRWQSPSRGSWLYPLQLTKINKTWIKKKKLIFELLNFIGFRLAFSKPVADCSAVFNYKIGR